MWLIVTRIPAGTNHAGLKKFVSRGMNDKWFFLPLRNRGEIKKCDILRISHPATKSVEYHGLLLVQPIKKALTAIEQLDGTQLDGETVDVRRYVHRTHERDRRDPFNHRNQAPGNERRRGDRRRSGIVTERIHQN
ncbi:MAG: RNA-binding protein [Gammaproteobacteria bacterium]|nr:RNA-binding protein [Gammaproteobacteria bacterium]